MGEEELVFHCFTRGRAGRVVITSTDLPVYAWLECWLAPPRRGNGEVPALVDECFGHLPGVHLLHFFPGMRTFMELAHLRRWKSLGESEWFDGCIAYETLASGRVDAQAGRSWTRRARRGCPKLRTYRSPEAQVEVVEWIGSWLRDHAAEVLWAAM